MSEEKWSGGEVCSDRVEGLGGVQAEVPAHGPFPETKVEQSGERVDRGEGGYSLYKLFQTI